MSADRPPTLLDSAPDVRLNTALYQFWRSLLRPLWGLTAAISGYHRITTTKVRIMPETETDQETITKLMHEHWTPELDRIWREAFPAARELHSWQYYAGAQAMLVVRVFPDFPAGNPFRRRTAAWDAFEAGKAEGKLIAKRAKLRKITAGETACIQ
jgi:hypothetical protein